MSEAKREIIKVHANSVDKIHIKFTCPFCWTRYKKNRTPTKLAKRVIHMHGSGNNLDNRTELRLPHCGTMELEYAKKNNNFEFEITIDDQTKRI
jgi:hypothetical protein